MQQKCAIRSEFYSYDTDKCGNGGIQLVIYYPEKKSERTDVAVIAMHSGNYTNFSMMKGMAERGFIAAGVGPNDRSLKGLMHAMNLAINEVKEKTGVKKVVLMAHSQGGCVLSCYQYIAENGTSRFTKYTDRLVPFPEIEKLTPADGLMLIDGNYGIMSVMALDPAVRVLDGTYERIPELDIFLPENGYKFQASHYSQEFIDRYLKAQLKMYRDLMAYAQERRDAILAGKSKFVDDEPILIPGGGGGSDNNKPFCMDTRLLGRTSDEQDILHVDGSITHEIAYTNRIAFDSVHSKYYRHGATTTTVMSLLQNEMRFFDNYGYDESHLYGVNEDFLHYSTRENVKGIHCPLLCQGNSGAHEFVNMEITYKNAVSEDKKYIFTLGSQHDYSPVSPEFTGISETICDYFADWLALPGRFL